MNKKETEESNLKKDNIRFLSENEKLWQENRDAKKTIDILRSDKDQLTNTVEELKLCIERLNKRIYELEADNKDLKVRINDAKQDAEDLRNQGAIPCEACANDAINDLTNAKQEIDRLNDDIDAATKMYLEERKKRKKLKKALLKAVMK